MTKRTTILAAAAAALFLLTAGDAALAKNKQYGGGGGGAPKARGHHCERGGVEVDQGKKQCRKTGGVWMDGPPHVTAAPTAAPPAAH